MKMKKMREKVRGGGQGDVYKERKLLGVTEDVNGEVRLL